MPSMELADEAKLDAIMPIAMAGAIAPTAIVIIGAHKRTVSSSM